MFHLLYFVLGPTTEKPNTWDVNIIFVTNQDSSLFHRAPGEFKKEKEILVLACCYKLSDFWTNFSLVCLS